ncbi:hypothetical protein MJH12_04595 [bacterium]|nr:hypothetical protein [bacterium]
MKIFNLLTILALFSLTANHAIAGNDFNVKAYVFNISNSWDARLIKVQAKSQITYLLEDGKMSMEVKTQKALIDDKKQGYARISFENFSSKIRSTPNSSISLKKIQYTLLFSFEKKNRRFDIEIDYPFYLRNLEKVQYFSKLPTHHRILRRRLSGLAFDLTDQEQKQGKIYNQRREDWLRFSEYQINDVNDQFSESFQSRYESPNEDK